MFDHSTPEVMLQLKSGSGRSNGKDLWVDKYKPGSLEELAVHKKKVKVVCFLHSYELCSAMIFPWFLCAQVEEVKMWFEKRLKRQKVQ